MTAAERLARNAQPRDALRAALQRAGRMAQAGPRYHRTVDPVRRFRWAWKIVDDSVSPHRVAASGHAVTKARAWARLERAYLRLLDAADGRAES